MILNTVSLVWLPEPISLERRGKSLSDGKKVAMFAGSWLEAANILKLLIYWYTLANRYTQVTSLFFYFVFIAMGMRKLGLVVAHSISQFRRPSQFEIVWSSSHVQSDTLCVIIPSLFKTSAPFRTPRCNLRRWFWLCIKSLFLKRKCSSKERTICCAGQPFAPENTCLGRPHSVPTIIEHCRTNLLLLFLIM